MILSVYLNKELSDRNLNIEILIYITESLGFSSCSDLSINKEILRIIFKMRKYYMIYVQNERSIDFDMSETVTKNILIYERFNKEV